MQVRNATNCNLHCTAPNVGINTQPHRILAVHSAFFSTKTVQPRRHRAKATAKAERVIRKTDGVKQTSRCCRISVV